MKDKKVASKIKTKIKLISAYSLESFSSILQPKLTQSPLHLQFLKLHQRNQQITPHVNTFISTDDASVDSANPTKR